MWISLVTFVLGWVSSYVWQRKSQAATEELVEIAKKLPREVVAALEQTRKEKLTLAEFEELLLERGFIPVDGGLIPEECPRCGERCQRETWGVHDERHGDDYAGIKLTCPSCDWTHSVHTA